jgi:hypothetical protein
MSSLLVFNGVYRLEIPSVMLVFSTGFMNYSYVILYHVKLAGTYKLTII